jgi:hypothetical protein
LFKGSESDSITFKITWNPIIPFNAATFSCLSQGGTWIFIDIYVLFVWSLYCISFDLRLRVVPLASLNFSFWNSKRCHIFSCPVIENFKWITPLSRGHLSYKATFSLSLSKVLIPPISTKRTMPSHLKILKIIKPRYISITIQVPPWDRHDNVAGLNRMMGSHVILNIMERRFRFTSF